MPHALYKLSKNKKVMHLVRTAQGTVKKVKALALKEAKAARNPIVIVRHKGKGSLPVRVKVVSNPSIDPYDAKQILSSIGIGVDADFHTLRSSQVERLLDEANKAKYRKPKNANGSRARYFCAYLQRLARKR